MKKFLSLVLALVMTMSLVTISAGAEDFTDDSTITYEEAVDVMSAIGVVGGYADGSFNPQGGLTRGAAAKIICNLVLGPTTAAALTADTAPYSDVPTTNTYAGYIAYCQQQGIISGYADGTFKPAAPLTGYAFMKMLLGALGYDATIEGYTGANWSVQVAKQALAIGLDDGLVTDLNGTKAVTREEACLYAFNMIQADMVEYDSKTTVNVNGAEITIGNSDAKAVKWNNSNDVDGNIDMVVNNNGEKGDGYIQFAEQFFNKLVKTGGDEDFSRPATTWTWKGVEVGTYADTATVSYVGSVKLNQIYKDLGMVAKDTDVQIFLNGLEIVSESDGVDLSKNNDTKLSTIDPAIGNGTLVEAYLNTNTNEVIICAISVYGGKITAVKDATAKTDAFVVVDGGSNAPAMLNTYDTFDTEDFAEDDVVAYTFSEKSGHEGIVTMETIESVEGALAKRVIGSSLTIGETTYKYAEEYTFDNNIGEESLTNKSEYVVYLDANGYALWIEESTFAVDQYALVLKILSNVNGFSSNQAKLLFADGSTKIVTLDKNYLDNGLVSDNDVVRFSVKDNGDYKLNKVTGKNLGVDNNFAVTNNSIGSTLQYDSDGNNTMVDADADSQTVFVLQNNDQTGYNVYTGIKNVPNTTGGTGYGYVRDGVTKVVFVMGGEATGSSKDITFIAGASRSNETTQYGDSLNYYVYNAVVAGEITTIQVAIDVDVDSTIVASYAGKFAAGGSKLNVIADTLIINDDDIITEMKDLNGNVDVKSAQGVKKISAEEIKLGGKILSVDKNVNVFFVDVDGNIEALESILDIKTDADDTVMYTMENGEITNIFVQEVDA